MGRGKSFREPRRRGFDDDDYSPRGDRGYAATAPVAPSRPIAAAAGPAAAATVKWFNPEKGFGFVAVDGGGDAFLHAAVLERSGHGAVQPGATLRVRTAQGQKGLQVSEVLEVDDSTASREAGHASRPAGPRPPDHGVPAGPAAQLAGTVKWFNAGKGFGFITPETGAKDVFVHVSALQRSGLEGLAEGQRVVMEVHDTQKGAEVRTLRLAD